MADRQTTATGDKIRIERVFDTSTNDMEIVDGGRGNPVLVGTRRFHSQSSEARSEAQGRTRLHDDRDRCRTDHIHARRRHAPDDGITEDFH